VEEKGVSSIVVIAIVVVVVAAAGLCSYYLFMRGSSETSISDIISYIRRSIWENKLK